MATKQVPIPSGVNLIVSESRVEDYDKNLKIRKIGSDNLYYQHVSDFLSTSPTLAMCVSREVDTLFGEYQHKTGFLTDQLVYQLLQDYSLFRGFALHVNYNFLGDVDCVDYIPFSQLRLGEQNAQGIYTSVFYCPDWAGKKTANGNRIDPKRSMVKYYTFTDNVDVRLRRIEAVGGPENYQGEILYYSNTNGYPVAPVDSVLQYVSAEVGLGNLVFRDVRCSFLPSAIVNIPMNSGIDEDTFAEQLSSLQGDTNAGRLIMFASASTDEKPEAVSLTTEGTDTRYENAKADCKNRIIDVYNQQCFTRLAEGSLGFGSEAISSIYKYYSWSLRPKRNKIVSVLQQIDPTFDLPELVYQYDDNVANATDNNTQIPITNG